MLAGSLGLGFRAKGVKFYGIKDNSHQNACLCILFSLDILD